MCHLRDSVLRGREGGLLQKGFGLRVKRKEFMGGTKVGKFEIDQRIRGGDGSGHMFEIAK